MALTLVGGISEIGTAIAKHGLVTYIGTNLGKIYRMVNTTGVVTLLDSVDEKIISMNIDHPTLYVSTVKGKIYTYAITASADPYAAASIGAQANVVGSGVAISSTATGAYKVFSDDNGANIGASVRGMQSRFLLTVDQSAGTIRALQGQLKALNLVDVTTGIYTAVQGYVELAGTHIVKTGATLSCFDSSLEIGTGLTVDSGGELFGIHVETTGAGTITNNGTCAGIGITKASGAASWPLGIYVSPLAVVTAIQVGSKANLAGSGVVIPSTDDWGAVRIFTDDNGVNVADSVRAIQSRTLLTISQSAGTIRGLQGQFKALTGVNFDTGVYTPVQGYIELAGTHTVSAAGILACFDASIEIGTALTATGYVAGFKAELTGTGTCGAGLDCGFLVTNAAGAAVWTYGLYVEASAVDTGVCINTCTTDIKLQSGSTIIDSNHLALRTLTDTKSITLNSRNYAATSGDIIGFSSKPAANASGTQTVYGGQISPRANDDVDIAALVGLQVEPILKGATVLAVSGDMRGMDVRLTSEGANNVGGIAGCYFAYNLLKSATFTGGVYPFVVTASGDTQPWTALMEIPTGLSGPTVGGGALVYIPITINGVAARIVANYVS